MSIEFPFPSKEKKIIYSSQNFSKKFKNLNNFFIFADYDETFTKRFNNLNERNIVTFGVIENFSLISNDFKKYANFLANKFRIYESDFNLDFNLRNEKLFEWYDLCLKAMVKENFNRNKLKEMLNECIKKNKIYFRFGVKKFFDIIIKFKLPLILISGGIKEIIIMEIVELIGNEKYNFLIDNNLLFIIANSFIFKNENNLNNENKNLNNENKNLTNENNLNKENNLNNENNNVIDYKKPIVYTFYKNLSVNNLIKELKLNELKLNVLFMGDNLNDIDAIKDIKFEEKKSIFFYNKEIENFPEKECFKKYDIAILNDGDFEIVNEILLNNFNL